MTNQVQDVKRRFDEVYRALVVIGPVLSFAFSNYAAASIFKQFVYNIGFPALMTSILIWGFAHFLDSKWEYHAKLVGYVLIWFTFLVLASAVYVRGNLLGSLWYEAAAGLTVLITLLSVWRLAKAAIVPLTYGVGMIAFAIALSIIVPFLV